MLLKERIKYKHYFLLSFISTLLFIVLFSQSAMETYVILGTCVAIHVNNLLLLFFVGQMLDPHAVALAAKKESSKKFFLLFTKILILGFSIGVGVHFIGDKIIIPLFNYLVHVFIFIFCLKRL